MPLYDFECVECGVIEEHLAKISETHRKCDACNGLMRRLITVRYHVQDDVDFVTDDISGEPVRVTSRKAHRQLMEEHGVEEHYGKGWI